MSQFVPPATEGTIDGLSHDEGASLPESYPSCWESLLAAAFKYPDSIALVSMHQPNNLYGIASTPATLTARCDRLRWTYRTLKTTAERLATGLAARGISSGTIVFTFLPNCAEFVLTLWAAWRLGFTLVPLNSRNLANRREFEHMIGTALRQSTSESAVVIAESQDIAREVESYTELRSAVKIMIEEHNLDDWLSFGTILDFDKNTPTFSRSDQMLATSSHDRMILFTSGTTDLPKGCQLDHPHGLSSWQAMLATGTKEIRAARATHGSVCAVVAPNNHLMWYATALLALCSGATVVFPGEAFEPQQFFAAAREEFVTHFIGVPTMIHALVSAKAGSSSELTSLRTIGLGGAGVSSQVVQACIDNLGAHGVEVLGGMTEQAVFSSGQVGKSAHNEHNTMTIGRCLPGCEVKICEPGSTHPVSLGTPGELHFTGPGLVHGYLGQSNSPNFYVEGQKRWIATGDMVTMDSEKRIYYVGRYKEMIIRGGVNISSSAIEACVTRELPDMKDVELSVVGLLDEVAGEVPIAVVSRTLDPPMVASIKRVISQHLGQMFALDDVITLQDVGITDYPRTALGKVQKSKLKDLVNRRIQKEGDHPTGGDSLDIKVFSVIARTTGIPVESILPTTELSELVDSIMLMRLMNRIAKETGRRLSMDHLIGTQTVGSLVKMLEQQPLGPNAVSKGNAAERLSLKRSLNAEVMIFLEGSELTFSTVKQVVEHTISPYGKDWKDVELVFPAYDFTRVLVQDGTLDKWSFKVLFLARGHTVESLRAALLRTWANNPMLASFIVTNEGLLGPDLALHVTMKHNDEFLASLIRDGGTVQSLDQLKTHVQAFRNHPQLPGPLVGTTMLYCEETQCAALIHNMHHAVTDATFASLVNDDLDQALGSSIALSSHVSYQSYCETLFTLRDSITARTAVEYHAEKLQHLSRHQEHLWPSLGRQLVLQEEKRDGYIHTFSAKPAQHLCAVHKGLAPSLVLKAATAMFLLRQTGHTHAVFSHVEAGRDRFPFLPKSILITAPQLQASDVGGQTFQLIMNLIQPGSEESTIDFLLRLQEEQNLQHNYAAAPWAEIMRSLDPDSVAFFPTSASTCFFNWLGVEMSSGPATFRNIEVVDAVFSVTAPPFANNCALRRRLDGDEIVLHLRGAVLSIEELRQAALEIETAAVWLAEEANWMKPVVKYLEWSSNHRVV
ncbi:unnamed protein product [Cercospora beticola]|nr:unnamed protein product [Cercospora beticola]